MNFFSPVSNTMCHYYSVMHICAVGVMWWGYGDFGDPLFLQTMWEARTAMRCDGALHRKDWFEIIDRFHLYQVFLLYTPFLVVLFILFLAAHLCFSLFTSWSCADFCFCIDHRQKSLPKPSWRIVSYRTLFLRPYGHLCNRAEYHTDPALKQRALIYRPHRKAFLRSHFLPV